MRPIVVYTDGGSRGNPGPSAWGFFIEHPDGRKEVEHGFIGVATNNEAEYQALLAAIRHLLEARVEGEVEFRLDSALVVGQVSKGWAVNAANLKPLRDEAQRLLANLPRWHMKQIPREMNRQADAAVNRALDARRG